MEILWLPGGKFIIIAVIMYNYLQLTLLNMGKKGFVVNFIKIKCHKLLYLLFTVEAYP